MSIHEYVREFNRLARYAQDEITTDARKQARFRKGLSPILRHDLNLLEFATFEDLVNGSFRAEHGNGVFEESRKHALELAPSSSSAPQIAEFGFQPVPYLKTFFRGHHPIYVIHLNTLYLPGMMVCNQVPLFPAIQAGCVSRVVCQAITS